MYYYQLADYSFLLQYGLKTLKFSIIGAYEMELPPSYVPSHGDIEVDCIGVLNQKNPIMYSYINGVGTKMYVTTSVEELDNYLRRHYGFLRKAIIPLDEDTTYSIYVMRLGSIQ